MFGRRVKKSINYDAAKENAIKSQLLENVKECVKVLQLENKNTDSQLTLTESTARFCSVLEALLIHGLKATFLGRLSRWGGGELSPRMPEPSFWTFALVFSHKQVITTVEKYSQISSEVGRSRAWLRQALNDGLLGSYLSAMAGDKVSLSVHYESYSLFRDSEKMDLILTYITGIEIFSFSLPTNVSMLNRWLPEPLVMAGVWYTTLQPMTDTGAIDAAAMEDDVSVTQQTFIRSLAQPVEKNSYMQLGLLNEDEALRFILQSTPVSMASSPRDARMLRGLSPTPIATRGEEPYSRNGSPESRRLARALWVEDSQTKDDVHGEDVLALESEMEPDAGACALVAASVDKSSECLLVDMCAPSSEPGGEGVYDTKDKVSAEEGDNPDLPEAQRECTDETPRSDGEDCSSPEESSTPSLEWDEEYQAMESSSKPQADNDANLPASVGEDELKEGKDAGKPDSNSSESAVWSCTCSTEGPRLECIQCRNQPDQPRICLSEFVEPDPGARDLIAQEGERTRRKQNSRIGFRVKPEIELEEFSLHRNLEMVSCLDIIPREAGLDTQDWRCVDCTKAIGALFGNGKVCFFTKKYYCEDCHKDDLSLIPARLVYNWDAKQYPVSKSSHQFIELAALQPVINLWEFNPALAEFVPVLETCRQSRQQLIYLVAYITACPRAQDLQLRDKLTGVLHGRDHLYSNTDIFSIKDLEDLHQGALMQTLRTAEKFCRTHVESCLICAGRGFICEVCQDIRPVYPFDLKTTSQCESCCTVFHSVCAPAPAECPRCERIAARSLNLLVAESKLSREVLE